MTHAELKQIFGDKLETIELKPPVFDVPDVFDNVAVYVSRNLSNVIRREAKILPAQAVKCHGVIPMSKEWKEKYDKLPPHERPFNCCVGDYVEEQHVVWIRGLEIKQLRLGEEYMFKASHSWGMPDGYATASCRKEDVDTWMPVCYADERQPAGYVGFFTDLAAAREAVKEKFLKRKQDLTDQLDNFYAYEGMAKKTLES